MWAVEPVSGKSGRAGGTEADLGGCSLSGQEDGERWSTMLLLVDGAYGECVKPL